LSWRAGEAFIRREGLAKGKRGGTFNIEQDEDEGRAVNNSTVKIIALLFNSWNNPDCHPKK
jgi:hypothetical protein